MSKPRRLGSRTARWVLVALAWPALGGLLGSMAAPVAADSIPPSDVWPVPASIDATGATDVAAELQAFLDGVPDGSTVLFTPKGLYQLSTGLQIEARSGLQLLGQSSTLEVTASDGEPRTSPFVVRASTGITIRGFTLVGTNPDGGTSAAHHRDRQNQGGVNVYGGAGVLIEAATIRGTWGDCLYVGAYEMTWATGVTFRDSTCEANGRTGVAIVAGRDVLVERVHFDAIATHVLDIEPDVAWQGAKAVRFLHNTVGTYGHSDELTPWFFAAEGVDGSTVREVEVSHNTVSGGTIAATADRPGRSAFVFTDNRGSVAAPGPLLHFALVDGLEVWGNEQPLTSGALLAGTVVAQGMDRVLVAVGGAAGAACLAIGAALVGSRRRNRQASAT